ncbi:glycosyltransferase [Gulosibacter sediminis]|uniref:glycosyltransferase n=1 Tax=Gulosibacter sediminis TaxID=1729695 RepID=UPI0024ACFF34|nr:glycosyltransferase [Gulosibacter sediminis]
MHSDERRSRDYIEALRTAELISDPVAVAARLVALQERHDRDKKKLAKVEGELSALKNAAKDRDKLAEELKHLQKQRDQLKVDLIRANGSLDAYRRETARLKEDLKRVRGSRAMQVGRSVLWPATAAKKLLQPTERLEATGPSAGSDAAAAESSGDETLASAAENAAAAGPSESIISTPKAVPVSQRSIEQLLEEFEAEPNADTLSRVINRQWYQLGLIHEPADLIDRHPEIVEKFTPQYSRLVEQIKGYERIESNAATIPARAPGIAYSAEPGRIMYCVHSTPAFNSNGYSTRTRGVAAGLRDGGHDVTVVARAGYPWDGPSDVEKPSQERTVRAVDDVEYVHLPGPGLGSTAIDHYILAAADAFVREARLQRPSIIHSASNFRTALAALIAARRLGVPFVYEVRGLWEITEAAEKPGWENTERYKSMERLETLVANEADSVLVITTQVADELERRGVDRAKMILATNAVDTNQFVPLPKDESYAASHKIRTDVPVLGFAGSIVPYEGLSLLVEASAKLAERGIVHQVAIAGSGDTVKGLKRQRDELGLTTVTFPGRLPMEEMPRLLSTFDIMPLPRVSSAVTELVSPLKPLEAFSSAKAVVFSDVAPHLDIAGPDEARGLVFPAGDASALADQLQRLIEDPELRADLGRKARLWTIDERTWSGLGHKITGAYEFARARHAEALPAPRTLSSLRVGLVADEFTSATLAASMQVTPIDRDRWREQLASPDAFDLVFIESAWAGNEGQWTRGVGHYGEQENADLYGALERCRELGIPTVFWNKEDPVHFARFRETAARCDHVFTTDANMIVPYLETPGAITKTASALPFYAQPAIHNPLPARTEYDPTAAYAGTYYGDRYAERSHQLRRLLNAATRVGLAIYDRQLAFPDSPYEFPDDLQEFVRGHLPYDQVIDSYKSHLAQLNVNSVTESPSMFSRRVVEVAGCGGVVLSGPGRGITETFGGVIPATNDNATWRALLHNWSTHPAERVREAWFQMRAIYRAHTVDTALVLLARTAGIPVAARVGASYGLAFDASDDAVLDSVARQSVLPREVFVSDGFGAASERLSSLGVRVRGAAAIEQSQSDWLGQVSAPVGRTHFEDLLLPTRFGDWNRITFRTATADDAGVALAMPMDVPNGTEGLVRRDLVEFSHGLERALNTRPVTGVELLFAPAEPVYTLPVEEAETAVPGENNASKSILVAGHDLKFARTLIETLEAAGHTILLDEWESHTKHDAERSEELLERADIVFCEWALGNAEWYSKRVKPHQRLVVRVHSQELRRPHLRAIAHKNVDEYIFVGELIRRAAIESHGVPQKKTRVIPNPVDVTSLQLPKQEGAEHTLGLVGIVAQPKRLDRALDLLERLLEVDGGYKLRIKGKQPADYPWMLNRPDEMAYYDAQYARIDAINAKREGAVVFDGFGPDMEEWYRNIGVAVSVSDFESFHLTIPDGAASGALPTSIDWPGADLIYPREWISATVEEMAQRVLSAKSNPTQLAAMVQERFGADDVLAELAEAISPSAQEQE